MGTAEQFTIVLGRSWIYCWDIGNPAYKLQRLYDLAGVIIVELDFKFPFNQQAMEKMVHHT